MRTSERMSRSAMTMHCAGAIISRPWGTNRVNHRVGPGSESSQPPRRTKTQPAAYFALLPPTTSNRILAWATFCHPEANQGDSHVCGQWKLQLGTASAFPICLHYAYPAVPTTTATHT